MKETLLQLKSIHSYGWMEEVLTKIEGQVGWGEEVSDGGNQGRLLKLRAILEGLWKTKIVEAPWKI